MSTQPRPSGSQQGFEVSAEGRGDKAVERTVKENPDVIVLNVNLPGLDGFSICKPVRPHYRGEIIMLTARGEEIDEVLGAGLAAVILSLTNRTRRAWAALNCGLSSWLPLTL